MDKLKHRRNFVRKAGQQVPNAVTRLMKTRHPTVEIMWEDGMKRWCLVQTIKGVSMLITMLGSPTKFASPTLQNTVYYQSIFNGNGGNYVFQFL